MWITSKNGGYVGRTTIIESLPDMPHGFHGVHISRDAHIGKQCVIYQNVTIGGVKTELLISETMFLLVQVLY